MKRILALVFAIMIGLFINGCRSTNSRDSNSDLQKQHSSVSGENQPTKSKTREGKKILVAYFSHTGNTRLIANQIHRSVGGDIFEIMTVDPYPTDYGTLVDQAKREQEHNYRPKLAAKVKEMGSYDVIFVGYPNWWGTMPMAVFAFLEEYSFSGKTIVPFCTHGGGGLDRSVADITKLCPHSTILEGLAVRDTKVKSARNQVSKWLRKIGMTGKLCSKSSP